MLSGRVIAIGDVHGHINTLTALWRALTDRYGPSDLLSTTPVVFLGDYVDRGPCSKAVIQFLCELKASRRPDTTYFLAGNHDFALAAYLGLLPEGSPTHGYTSQRSERKDTLDSIEDDSMHLQGRRYAFDPSVYDNDETFVSYGVSPRDPDRKASLDAAMPAHHKAFLKDLLWVVEHEKYVFVHAGLKVGFSRPPWRDYSVAQQLQVLHNRDVSSARPDPLCERYFPDDATLGLEGRVVVCGHVPVRAVEFGKYVIRVDTTGGIDGRPLSAVLLPDNEITTSS